MTPRRVAYLLLFFLCACFFIKYRQWAFDDSFIAYRYVENILNGHGWVYNVGEPYNASTSVLNIVLLTILTPIFRSPLTASIFLGSVSIFFAGVLIRLD